MAGIMPQHVEKLSAWKSSNKYIYFKMFFVTQCAFSYLILTAKYCHKHLQMPQFCLDFSKISGGEPPQERRAFGARRTRHVRRVRQKPNYYCHPSFYTNCLLTHHFNLATPLQAITRTGVNSVPNPGPFGVIYGWWSRCLKLLIILTATDLCLVDTLLENIE